MNKGFTLVELIVVVAIIGLLATVGITSYNNTLEDSKRTKALADIREIEAAIKVHYFRTGGWLCGVSGTCGASDNISTTAVWNQSATGIVPTYLESVPDDPWGGSYFYDGAPSTECGEGEVSVCSAGRDGEFESQNRADKTLQGDDVCVYIPPDC